MGQLAMEILHFLLWRIFDLFLRDPRDGRKCVFSARWFECGNYGIGVLYIVFFYYFWATDCSCGARNTAPCPAPSIANNSSHAVFLHDLRDLSFFLCRRRCWAAASESLPKSLLGVAPERKPQKGFICVNVFFVCIGFFVWRRGGK